MCLTLALLELGVRIHRGEVLSWHTFAEPAVGYGMMGYHPRLGWVPRAGRFGSDWNSSTDSSGIRSNGASISSPGRPILAVGDSFTFGDEVEDSSTWAAYLEKTLNRRVLNAGVGAYGIDQAVLRAELLLSQYDPAVVILSFISDDINRTEFSYYPYGRGWKPYFEYQDGALRLRNVPVPQIPTPHRFRSLRRVLGYSLLADAIFDRVSPQWWKDLPVIRRMHRDGRSISVDLLVHLDSLTRGRNAQFIAIAFATNGQIGSNSKLPEIVERARARGVRVLDLSLEVLALTPSQQERLFMPGGHYSPVMNRSVAESIATVVREIAPAAHP